MRIGQIYDCELVIDLGFAALVVVALLAGWVVEVVIVLGALLTHELAHLVVGRGFGLEFRRIHLLPYGGVAEIDNLYAADPPVVAVTALAGPVNNLLLFVASYGLMELGWLAPPAGQWMLRVNLFMALFNLIPALPLDGGRMVQALLRGRIGELAALRRLAGWGYVVAGGLVAGAAIAAAFGIPLPTVPILAIFVATGARREWTAATIGHLRPLWRRPEVFTRKGVLPAAALVAGGEVTVSRLLPHLAGQRYHLIWVLDRELRPRGRLSEVDIVRAALDGGLHRTLNDLLDGPR